VSPAAGRPLRTKPAPPGALADQLRAEREQAELLPLLRTAAERWTAAIGALLAATGVAGIASGPAAFRALDDPWGELGTGVLLVGVAGGVAGLWLAARASMQRFDPILVGGETRRRVVNRRFEEARRQLRWAQVASAIAIGALLLSAVILWTAPQEPASDPLVQGRDAAGRAICGPLAGRGTVTLVAADGTGALVRDLRDLRVVARCPQTR
jgi:hypothetical protein